MSPNMPSHFDTIVAPITGVQKAAVAWIRLSGPEAWQVASQVFSPWPVSVVPRLAVFGRYLNGDEGLALPFEEGHSYTGEQSVELSVHGSPSSVSSLLAACLANGAREAEPGEFTLRAFLNGRIDLTKAEAVRETVDALTVSQLRAANRLRRGELHDHVSSVASAVLSVLTDIEARVDFSEEIGDLDRPSSAAALSALLLEIDELLKHAATGRLVRHGLRIAIVGPPNAGKSSILNAILGTDRAIVTEIPGTTRDYVEEFADVQGVPCVLVDTAGLRETIDPVESIGVQRSVAQAASADWVWYVVDSVVGKTEADEAAIRSFESEVLVVWNKADLVKEPSPQPSPMRWGRGNPAVSQLPGNRDSSLIRKDSEGSDDLEETIRKSPLPPRGGGLGRGQISLSATTKQGFETLYNSIKAKFKDQDESPLINERHEPLLKEAKDSIVHAIESLDADIPLDLASTDLRNALHALGLITGETADQDVLDAIFRQFCLGK